MQLLNKGLCYERLNTHCYHLNWPFHCHDISLEKERERETDREMVEGTDRAKLNTFVSAHTYHKPYENRALIVFVLKPL